MKNLLIGIVLVASATAAAQTATRAKAPRVNVTQPQNQKPEEATTTTTTTTTASPNNTLSTTVEEEKKSWLQENFGASLAIESAAPVYFPEDEKTGIQHDTPVLTLSTFGLKYKATKKFTAEIQQMFISRTHGYGLAGAEATYLENGRTQVGGDFVVKGDYKTELTFLGSKPLSFGSRYYLPTSYYSRNSHTNGTLRADVNPSWDLDTRWTMDLAISPRVKFNSPNSRIGSDAVYRLVFGPYLTYNFNDAFNLYGAAVADWRSVSAQRGVVATDNAAYLTPELGANYNIGAFTINPAITSDVLVDDGSHRVFTPDSRVFAYETSSYNLNIYASF